MKENEMTGETAKHVSTESFFNRHEASIAGIAGALAMMTPIFLSIASERIPQIGQQIHEVVERIPGVQDQLTIPGPADFDSRSMASISVIMPEAA
jgi:hypothetical protein